MAKFRRSPKFGRNHSCLGSLDGIQFTHPLAEITQRTRWGPEKVQVTLKPFRGSRKNHYELSLPTLGSFRYPQAVQNGPFGLKQTLTGRKALYMDMPLHELKQIMFQDGQLTKPSLLRCFSSQKDNQLHNWNNFVDCDGLKINNPG